jgi:hypothetical protein
MGKRSGLNCRDGFCGALDCETCHGITALWYRREAAHEKEHQTPDHTCAVCIMERYERMCQRAGKVFPRDLMRKAWEAV